VALRPLQEAELLEILAKAVMRRLATRPDPDALAVLLAIAAIAPSQLDAAAREAVEKLRTAATPEPVWSRSIGRPVLVDASISTDELDDQSTVLAAFAYARRPAHAFNLIIDANFQGLIRSIFVTNDPDEVRRASGSCPRPGRSSSGKCPTRSARSWSRHSRPHPRRPGCRAWPAVPPPTSPPGSSTSPATTAPGTRSGGLRGVRFVRSGYLST
jgi:hypothetical protein